jgi:hypothetical protein
MRCGAELFEESSGLPRANIFLVVMGVGLGDIRVEEIIEAKQIMIISESITCAVFMGIMAIVAEQDPKGHRRTHSNNAR